MPRKYTWTSQNFSCMWPMHATGIADQQIWHVTAYFHLSMLIIIIEFLPIPRWHTDTVAALQKSALPFEVVSLLPVPYITLLQLSLYLVRFEILTAVTLKITVFWMWHHIIWQFPKDSSPHLLCLFDWSLLCARWPPCHLHIFCIIHVLGFAANITIRLLASYISYILRLINVLNSFLPSRDISYLCGAVSQFWCQLCTVIVQFYWGNSSHIRYLVTARRNTGKRLLLGSNNSGEKLWFSLRSGPAQQ
jgi:hypothetical protein